MRGPKKLQGHKTLVERKSTGAHYTPSRLSDFMAQQLLKSWLGVDKQSLVKILDPAVGDGQLIHSVFKELIKKGFINIHVSAYDTDLEAIRHCKQSLTAMYPEVKFSFFNEDFLEGFLGGMAVGRSGQRIICLGAFRSLRSAIFVVQAFGETPKAASKASERCVRNIQFPDIFAKEIRVLRHFRRLARSILYMSALLRVRFA